ncbi:MAG TPA: tyrosine-type recombinase/integrase, partial [Burkholderiaceae bacterium]|nr:tyrosine-type recombinase/integrase [Burkholderiaceae bacterium]
GPDAPFLLTARGKRISRAGAEKAFKQMRAQAVVYRDEGARYQPRLHDMRHTAAVTRLVRWYRDGADVQRLLPQLATYLGHVHITGTQHYLSMTPELLQQASVRFEQFVFGEADHA